MNNDKDCLYRVLNSYCPLGSPFINSFNLDEPLVFPFRFKGKNKEDDIYKSITERVKKFRGNIEWIMHDQGSRKNFTIEPRLFYEARKKINSMERPISLQMFLGVDFYRINNLAINEVCVLSNYLKDFFREM